jgi:hypothetical protein
LLRSTAVGVHAPLHAVSLNGHEQVLAMHVVPPVHAWPHAPQSALSDDRSWQVPPQLV